ncbi:hypothetical protein HDV00_012096, partial [Rhizophlyctis rosea]
GTKAATGSEAVKNGEKDVPSEVGEEGGKTNFSDLNEIRTQDGLRHRPGRVETPGEPRIQPDKTENASDQPDSKPNKPLSGENSQVSESKQIETDTDIPLMPSIFEELRGSAYVSGEILDVVFGLGCREAQAKSQEIDKLNAAAWKKPADFQNFLASKGDDASLRFNGRILIPLKFEWKGRLFTRTLIEYVLLEKADVGVRDTTLGLKGYFWERMHREITEFVKECDECQRA